MTLRFTILGCGSSGGVPRPSHLSVSQALDWIESLKPKRAILTNLHTDLDYDELRSRLPHNVEPAYDGLSIELPDA